MVPAPSKRAGKSKQEDPDRVLRTDELWVETAQRWLDDDWRIKELEKHRSGVAEELCALQPTGSASGGGVTLTRLSPIGSVDVGRMEEVLGEAEVARFRRPRKEITRISATRGTSSGTRAEVGAVEGADLPTIRAATFVHEDGAS